jgi:phage terminase small subunit
MSTTENEQQDAPPPPPRGLDSKGLALWRAVVAENDLRPDELTVLGAACRTADELVRLEAELSGAELLVEGSAGQLRAHPLIAEVRAHRKLLGSLLRQLGLVEEDVTSKPVPLSLSRARAAAANVRWSRARADGESA